MTILFQIMHFKLYWQTSLSVCLTPTLFLSHKHTHWCIPPTPRAPHTFAHTKNIGIYTISQCELRSANCKHSWVSLCLYSISHVWLLLQWDKIMHSVSRQTQDQYVAGGKASKSHQCPWTKSFKIFPVKKWPEENNNFFLHLIFTLVPHLPWNSSLRYHSAR